MSDRNAGGATNFPAVLNGLLLVFTLVGGVMLVSSKLISQRPLTQSVENAIHVGDQTLEARLWEDPFKSVASKSGGSVANNLGSLLEQIGTRSRSASVLLLPVMIPGGSYSEDQEARIRCRFAIVSALGQKGFAPADAEHIGEVRLPWPKTSELPDWDPGVWRSNQPSAGPEGLTLTGAVDIRNETNSAYVTNVNLFLSRSASHAAAVDSAADGTAQLRVRYEWYRARQFYPHPTNQYDQVLVLWLDDASFEDAPVVRLPLFLQPLIEKISPLPGGAQSNAVAHLIGPYRSSTLRYMAADSIAGSNLNTLPTVRSNLVEGIRTTRARIALYCATISAMDEAFSTNTSSRPREAVRANLRANGFPAAWFFNATDAQLATEIYDELRLRKADMRNSSNHIVLLSEWDTFYGRMLALTYGATLAKLKDTNSLPLSQYVTDYCQHGELPTNFHNFVYLRGLDGRTVGGEGYGDSSGSALNRTKPKSVQDLLQWVPDANKAEGPGQYDYLSRLGERIETLREQLARESRGSLKAIGIVGSDAYDALLILQALRPRFPDILFFTADLDARFWHPSERAWARNLIVVSSYGLTLHPGLQQEIAPFRDSLQTGVFAATLAALGETNLTSLSFFAPRRFEIGNHGAVDLSVSNVLLAGPQKHGLFLHPSTRSESYHLQSPKSNALAYPDTRAVSLSLGIAVFVFLFWLYFRADPFRSDWRLFRFNSKHPVKTGEAEDEGNGRLLHFQEVDLGGREGADVLLRALAEKAAISPYKEIKAALLQKQQDIFTALPTADEWGKIREDIGKSAASPEKKDIYEKMVSKQKDRCESLLEFLNQLLTAGSQASDLARKVFPEPMQTRRQRWGQLDHLLQNLTAAPDQEENLAVQVGRYARTAASELFRGAQWFWSALGLIIVMTVVGIGVCVHVVAADTFSHATGEPFSLTSGISAWPNIILRYVVTLVSTVFIIFFLHRLRSSFYELTRQYRIPLKPASKIKPGHVCASALWHEFRCGGRVKLRLLRAVVACAFYFGAGMCLFKLLGFPFEPVRGAASQFWAAPVSIFGMPGFHPFFLFYLLLCFLTIDAALRCHRFIDALSAAPTDYPETTRVYYQSLRGDVAEEFLDEWIDTQLIADLTERAQKLLWLPSFVFFLMLATRWSWTDHWPWSTALGIIIILNFFLAFTSVIILQLAARRAKKRAEADLLAKVKKAQAVIAVNAPANNAAQAEKLLDEIRDLKRGAFVGFWENPALGAVFLAPGGTALIQLLVWVANR